MVSLFPAKSTLIEMDQCLSQVKEKYFPAVEYLCHWVIVEYWLSCKTFQGEESPGILKFNQILQEGHFLPSPSLPQLSSTRMKEHPELAQNFNLCGHKQLISYSSLSCSIWNSLTQTEV